MHNLKVICLVHYSSVVLEIYLKQSQVQNCAKIATHYSHCARALHNGNGNVTFSTRLSALAAYSTFYF